MGGFMRLLSLRCGIALLALALLTPALRAANFYPPLPAAKSSIDFDNRGFLINGQRTFIASAGIEYARVPRALWRDRLLKIKRSGFNCVEIYAFWNYHETNPGVWDFTGDKDVGAFLDLAHELGLYVTVRVGPYVCAEWENGGFPMYLHFQPGLRARQNEPTYLKDVDGWYDHILPIVASRQIERGGSVIMVQLENEDDEGWGAWNLDPVHQAYFKNLLDKARACGIDVLTFFSGMNHGGDPAPKEPISSKGRENPWYTTEFWSAWYSRYGAMNPTDLIHYDRAAWRFLENGGNGFNVYMFHGGTNFATWNNNETAASYDYAGAIGQAGDLRPIYYKYKRIALFGRSFQDILENCDDASDAHKNDFPGLTVRARTGPAGTLVFLDNPGTTPVDAKFSDGQALTLAPGEVTGLVSGPFRLPNTNLGIDSSEARILDIAQQGGTTTIVAFGRAGSTGRINFVAMDGDAQSSPAKNHSSVQFDFPAGQPKMQEVAKGLRILCLSDEMADKTYFIEEKGGTSIVTGAPYVGDFAPPAQLTVETPIDATASPEVTIYDAGEKPITLASQPLPSVDTTAPVLADWKSVAADVEAAPGYDDSKWKASDAPLPMGADGDNSAYVWYRTTLNATAAGTQYLQVPFIGDHAIVFVNGKRIDGTYGPGPTTIPVTLQAGANPLAVLVSHSGRSKGIGTYGAIERLDMKGLVGPIRLLPAQTTQIVPDKAVAQDYWKEHPPVETLVDPKLDTSDPKWSVIGLHNNFGYAPQTWRDPFVCIRATLPDIAGPDRVLHVGVFDERATFYLNGQKIGQAHDNNWNAANPNAYANPPAPAVPDDSPLVNGTLDLPLGTAWKDGGPNLLAIILENSHAQATVGLLSLTSGAPGVEVKGWKMRGGTTDQTSPSLAWTPAPATAPGVPTYYRTAFDVPKDYYTNATPILRLSAKGMSRGFAWLNGHNLGRYPEKIAIDGLYLPECWIKPGANDLVVLDEEGAAIQPEHLYVEMAASRRVIRR
jgi:beta-galactosidase